jgi:hypothetical protein
MKNILVGGGCGKPAKSASFERFNLNSWSLLTTLLEKQIKTA